VLAFDGVTYQPELDEVRLTGQLGRVYRAMKDGHWRTLEEITELAGGSQAGVSARIRDLRKEKWGGYTIEKYRSREAAGTWYYRINTETPMPFCPDYCPRCEHMLSDCERGGCLEGGLMPDSPDYLQEYRDEREKVKGE
jgi:hypothetical protein